MNTPEHLDRPRSTKLDLARCSFQTSDGVRLVYQDWGRGKPMVFVHAWAMTSDMWQYTIADFEERGFRAIGFDRRGHGRSDRPGHGYTIERLADDLGELLEALDLANVTLVAHSLGGTEAVAYLSRFGVRRVARLVLLAPATPFLCKTDDNPDGLDLSLDQATRARWTEDFPRWLDDNAEDFYRPSVFGIAQGIVGWTKAIAATTPIQVALRTGRLAFETDLRNALRSLTIPTLVIHGDHDRSIPVEFGRATAALIPHATYREYAGAPHGLFLTHRRQVRDDLLAFIGDSRL